jgi:hypothetical protein
MRVRQFLCLIGMAVGLSLPTAVRAADILPVQSGSCHIRLSGPIATGDAKRIETIVNSDEARRPIKIDDSSEHRTVLCLDSPGGSYVEGLRLMNLMRDKGIGTVIERNAGCFSACALVFMAGQIEEEEALTFPWRHLHFGGRLGFHAPYYKTDKETYQKEEVQQLIDGLILTTSWLLQNSERSSIPVSLIAEMLRYGPSGSLNVDNVLRAGRWNITPYGSSIPISATERSANYLCQNQYVWERYDDYTSGALAREYVEENRLSDLYKMPSGVSVKKTQSGMRVSVPGFPPEGTRICVVDFVLSKGRVTKVHQVWDFDYEEKRPPFAEGGEVPAWKLLPLNVVLYSLVK